MAKTREKVESRWSEIYNKKGGGVLREGFTARYAMIDELRVYYPIPALCRQFKVSLSVTVEGKTHLPRHGKNLDRTIMKELMLLKLKAKFP